MTDNSVVLRAKDGELDAFEELVLTYQDKLYSFVYHLIRDAHTAEDLTQEAFIKIYKSLAFFREESNFLTWAYSICRNVVIDHVRRERKKEYISLNQTDGDGEEFVFEIADETFNPEKMFEKRETMTRVEEAIGQIPDNLREIFLLRDVSGLSYAEISEILDIEIGTVKSRISRARAQISKIFVNDWNN